MIPELALKRVVSLHSFSNERPANIVISWTHYYPGRGEPEGDYEWKQKLGLELCVYVFVIGVSDKVAGEYKKSGVSVLP